MDVASVKELCAGYPDATSRLYAAPSNILVYYVGGRKFAYFKTSDPEKWRFSIRVSADRFLELTDVPGIKPARYLARFHWVTIVDVSSVPAAYLRELLDWSFGTAIASRKKGRPLQVTRKPK